MRQINPWARSRDIQQNVFYAVISKTSPRKFDIIVWNEAVQHQNHACNFSSNSVDWFGSSRQPKQFRVPISESNTTTFNTTSCSYFMLNLCVKPIISSCKSRLFSGGVFFKIFFTASFPAIFGIATGL